MHGHASQDEFLRQISGFLGAYYLVLAAMNVAAASRFWRTRRSRSGRRPSWRGWPIAASGFCLLAAVFFAILSFLALRGEPRLLELLSIPQPLRNVADAVLDPKWCLSGLCLALLGMFWLRRFFVRPAVAWTGLNLVLLGLGFSLTDPDFTKVVAAPDNLAIVGMVFLLGYFTWLSAYRAVQNDDRMRQGGETVEATGRERVLVWPDLVYVELICMVALTAVLIVWAILVKAPLEEPANPAVTPNPSKAPWYFVGLQEMLLYYDPWIAGVMFPSLILFGLMAIPYLDVNTKGNGYYTIEHRKFAYLTFQFGFLGLWIALLVIGVFLRGPNWSSFGLYETWDMHKVETLNNVSLSEYFWIVWLGLARPEAPADAQALARLGYLLYRELPGIVLLLLYGCAAPFALTGCRFFRRLYQQMGLLRYCVMMFLLLVMLLLPIKMVCRWVFHLNYFIAIPGASF